MNLIKIGKYTAQIIKPSCVKPKRVEKILKKLDKSFYEPLSMRVNIKEYSDKLSEKAINFFLILSSNDIAHAAIYVMDKQSKIFVTNFGVIHKYQGKGIGGLLLKLIENYAIKSDIFLIELEVNYQSINVIKFYTKNGFKKKKDKLIKNKSFLTKDIKI